MSHKKNLPDKLNTQIKTLNNETPIENILTILIAESRAKNLGYNIPHQEQDENIKKRLEELLKTDPLQAAIGLYLYNTAHSEPGNNKNDQYALPKETEEHLSIENLASLDDLLKAAAVLSKAHAAGYKTSGVAKKIAPLLDARLDEDPLRVFISKMLLVDAGLPDAPGLLSKYEEALAVCDTNTNQFVEALENDQDSLRDLLKNPGILKTLWGISFNLQKAMLRSKIFVEMLADPNIIGYEEFKLLIDGNVINNLDEVLEDSDATRLLVSTILYRSDNFSETPYSYKVNSYITKYGIYDYIVDDVTRTNRNYVENRLLITQSTIDDKSDIPEDKLIQFFKQPNSVLVANRRMMRLALKYNNVTNLIRRHDTYIKYITPVVDENVITPTEIENFDLLLTENKLEKPFKVIQAVQKNITPLLLDYYDKQDYNDYPQGDFWYFLNTLVVFARQNDSWEIPGLTKVLAPTYFSSVSQANQYLNRYDRSVAFIDYGPRNPSVPQHSYGVLLDRYGNYIPAMPSGNNYDFVKNDINNNWAPCVAAFRGAKFVDGVNGAAIVGIWQWAPVKHATRPLQQ